jgi:GGDEF domain-containing protein
MAEYRRLPKHCRARTIYDVGELLLKEVALRLRNCLRESDTVSRMDGDGEEQLIKAADTTM